METWGDMALAIIETFPSVSHRYMAALTSHKLTKVTHSEGKTRGNESSASILCNYHEFGNTKSTKVLVMNHDRDSGKISLGDSEIGSLETFPNGEFVMKINWRVCLVESSIHWTPNPSIYFYGKVRCSECCMSKFKSGSYESSKGRASSVPEHWALPFQVIETKKKKTNPTRVVADVLICQNSHCGKYLFLNYRIPWPDSRQIHVNFHTMPVPCASVSRVKLEREELAASIDHLPICIARLVVDFLEPPPNCFRSLPPPGSPIPKPERVIDREIGLTYEFLDSSEGEAANANYILRIRTRDQMFRVQ